MTTSIFGNGFINIERAAYAREQLQAKYASNIANADTPNFKADNRTFDDIFSKSKSIRQMTTNPKHISTMTSTGPSFVDEMSFGNSNVRVNVEKEMSDMTNNQLMYDLSLKLLRGKINSIREVIKEGGR